MTVSEFIFNLEIKGNNYFGLTLLAFSLAIFLYISTQLNTIISYKVQTTLIFTFFKNNKLFYFSFPHEVVGRELLAGTHYGTPRDIYIYICI